MSMLQNSIRRAIVLILAIISVVLIITNIIFLHQKLLFITGAVFIIANILLLIYLIHKSSAHIYKLQSLIEINREQANILDDDNTKSRQLNDALKSRIIRYGSLKKIIEDLNRNLKLDSTVDTLTEAVYSLISKRHGTALLFLVDSQTQKLQLARSLKEDNDLVILSKEGDIFDLWVLRHSSVLIITNLKQDFRFDTDSLRNQDLRSTSSIISSPLISHHSLLGVLRLENKLADFFTQDDLRFLALVSDLGAIALENSLLFQKTQDLAIHDDLTRLYTRYYFLGRLKEEAKRCIRLDQHLSVLMLDIDLFKKYNDKFGHTAGDIVLRKISHLMQESLHEYNCLISRFGGEEFLVMLSGLDKKKSFLVAESLRQKIEKEKIILRRQETKVTVSIGIANMPYDTKDEDELVQKADKAMYDAKLKGRNQVCCI
ncbi:MAG: sensor domain-containing diguanylate cyclase [Candidatus Omnitrophica bacterium]|nr:sensor domain-containing diguanylate cyclase [Candidatus Omnitrophota bacterium]